MNARFTDPLERLAAVSLISSIFDANAPPALFLVWLTIKLKTVLYVDVIRCDDLILVERTNKQYQVTKIYNMSLCSLRLGSANPTITLIVVLLTVHARKANWLWALLCDENKPGWSPSTLQIYFNMSVPAHVLPPSMKFWTIILFYSTPASLLLTLLLSNLLKESTVLYNNVCVRLALAKRVWL